MYVLNFTFVLLETKYKLPHTEIRTVIRYDIHQVPRNTINLQETSSLVFIHGFKVDTHLYCFVFHVLIGSN